MRLRNHVVSAARLTSLAMSLRAGDVADAAAAVVLGGAADVCRIPHRRAKVFAATRLRSPYDEVHASPLPSRRRAAAVRGVSSQEEASSSTAQDPRPRRNDVVPSRLDLLLVELDELWRPSRVKWTLTELPGASGLKLSHPEMTREWAAKARAHRGVTLADVEDLEAAGLVAVGWGLSRNGRRGDLRLTSAGEAHVDRLASPPSAPAEAIGSDWQQNVMPLLLAAAAIERDMAPSVGITQDAVNAALERPPGDPQTSTTLVQLSAAGYFRDEQSIEQIDGPSASVWAKRRCSASQAGPAQACRHGRRCRGPAHRAAWRPVPAYERVAAQPILAPLATAGYDGMKTNLAESVGLVDHPLGRGSVTSNVHRAGQITRLAHPARWADRE